MTDLATPARWPISAIEAASYPRSANTVKAEFSIRGRPPSESGCSMCLLPPLTRLEDHRVIGANHQAVDGVVRRQGAVDALDVGDDLASRPSRIFIGPADRCVRTEHPRLPIPHRPDDQIRDLRRRPRAEAVVHGLLDP